MKPRRLTPARFRRRDPRPEEPPLADPPPRICTRCGLLNHVRVARSAFGVVARRPGCKACAGPCAQRGN
jgi:hypothetical protein